ncbi:hypothetical protein NEIRO02_2654, partial [Nematocida sp. AWRm79]
MCTPENNARYHTNKTRLTHRLLFIIFLFRAIYPLPSLWPSHALLINTGKTEKAMLKLKKVRIIALCIVAGLFLFFVVGGLATILLSTPPYPEPEMPKPIK